MIITMPDPAPESDDQSNRINLPWTKLTESGQYSIEEVIQAYYFYLIKVAHDVIHPALQSKIAPSDLVQESIVAAIAKPEMIYGKSSQQLRVWLISVMMNKYKQNRRDILAHGEVSIEQYTIKTDAKHAPKTITQGDPNSPDPFLTAHRKEVAAIVICAVNHLPAKLSDVVRLKIEEELNVVQIAARLNIDKSAAQRRYERAILLLRKMPEIQKLNRFIG
jgi:RNA polymerase sigma factor (sigma-70 family)